MNRDLSYDDPARIEREIEATRASLHRKVDELQHRLNPKERVRSAVHTAQCAVQNAVSSAQDAVQHAVSSAQGAVRNGDARAYAENYAGAAAVGAIAVGTALALRGLRRCYGNGVEHVEPSAVDIMGE